MGLQKLLTAPEESFPALPNLSIWQKIEYVPCPNLSISYPRRW